MKNLVKGNSLDIKRLKYEFINYLDVGDKTLLSYQDGIESFIKYLESIDNLSSPTRQDVIDFRNSLFTKGYKSNTINSYMVAIRSLFRFLDTNSLYPDITIDVKGAKVSATPKTQVLSLETAQTIYKSLTDKRERVIFGLMITTGLRVSEVADALIEDIKVHNGEIVLWIKCKGHTEKDEYVKLSNEVLVDIFNYISDRCNGYLVVGNGNNNYGDKVTEKTIRTIIKNIYKRFGIEEDYISAHTLRRTFATISYNELGADPKRLQQVLHHVNIATTMRYINSSTRDKNKSEIDISKAILG